MRVAEVISTPSFSELVRVSTRIGWLSFGGPAGQIALMHRELVEERKWIGETQFLNALNFCHLLPGPEAQQLATYIGWKLHGVRGGLAAGMLFVVPGALVMLALSLLYVSAADLHWFAAVFLGVKAAVIAIVAQALIRVGGRALTTNFRKAIAVAAFIALLIIGWAAACSDLRRMSRPAPAKSTSSPWRSRISTSSPTISVKA